MTDEDVQGDAAARLMSHIAGVHRYATVIEPQMKNQTFHPPPDASSNNTNEASKR